MATINITEFYVDGPDDKSAPPVPAVAKDTLTYTVKTESAAFVGNLVRLVASADCYVQFGATVDVTTDDILLKSGVVAYFSVAPGHKLDVWDGTSV